MENKQQQPTAPKNRGGRTTQRPVNRMKVYYAFVDQGDLTPENVREAIDQWLERKSQ